MAGKNKESDIFFRLLRQALGGGDVTLSATDAEWHSLHEIARQQSLLGVVYTAASRQKMPLPLLLEWTAEAEDIHGQNELQYREASRLTKLFDEEGRQTAILKGQANARLYPDKYNRQTGDIDIWVEGGKKSVMALLRKMGMMQDLSITEDDSHASVAYHHVHLPVNEHGVTVEVHFRPSPGNYNPLTTRRLQRWLEKEIQNTTLTEEGFYVPSMRFALVMQLAHIQRHFFGQGLGLRQVCDYYMLLLNCNEEDRQVVKAQLRRLGLRRTAAALMWIIDRLFYADGEDSSNSGSAMKEWMLCPPDGKNGRWMLEEIMAGGNFGNHAEYLGHGTLRRKIDIQKRYIRLSRLGFSEAVWRELDLLKEKMVAIPARIKNMTHSKRNKQV